MSEERKVFVSYSRADKDKVLPLVKNLEKSVGTKFWIDLEGIESTAQFLNVIRQAIKDSQVVLFMLSDNSVNGEWTQREIMFAKECGKRVVPVILDGGGLRDWTELYFANVNYVDAKNRHQIEKLSKEIAEWLEPEEIVGQTDDDIAATPTRSVTIKKVLSRLVASLKTIILVAATLIVILCAIDFCAKGEKDEQDEEQIQDAELINEKDTLASSGGSDAAIATMENIKKTQTSAIENSSNDKVDISSEQSSAISSTAVQSSTTGTINGHAYVDLGLSVKWGTCNVGASSPEEFGNYYAWGETSTKSEYTNDNSKTYNNSNYNYDIAGNPSLDAARANWGSTWRMPTAGEMTELKDKCTWTLTTQGGKNGCKVTGPNGKSIFLPAAGYRYNQVLLDANSNLGDYWTSTPFEEDECLAQCLFFFNQRHSSYRRNGFPIRPVTE